MPSREPPIRPDGPAAPHAAPGPGLSPAPTRHVPAVLVSAPASGHGKTTVVAALARLLSRQGQRVRVFKYGPDFLDPAWHALASGATVHNLDLGMTGEADIRQRLYEAAGEADFIIVEGVMGLHDGDPSAAELARRLDLPVLAVIDAARMAGTFAALAHGLRTWLPGLRWAGTLANRVASPRHAQLLADSVRQRPDMPPAAGEQALPPIDDAYLGAIFRNDHFGLPSRHLGLVPEHELPDALARLDVAADALADTVFGRLDAARLAAWTTAFDPPSPPLPSIRPRLAGTRIAIARDAAFSFIYPANLDTLRALGAELLFFSPLAGDALPACDALWLPGGYPELHAEALAGRQTLAAQLRQHVQAGKPVWAECGGMLPLFGHLHYQETEWPMWGILPGRIRFDKRLAGLGMQQLHWPGPAQDAPLHGHTFHYSRCETPLHPVAHSHRPDQPGGGDRSEAVYRFHNLHASYFHAWFASAPDRVAALFLPQPASTASGTEAGMDNGTDTDAGSAANAGTGTDRDTDTEADAGPASAASEGEGAGAAASKDDGESA